MEKILRTQNKGGLENPARLNQNKGGMENILRTAYPSLVLLNGKGEYHVRRDRDRTDVGISTFGFPIGLGTVEEKALN